MSVKVICVLTATKTMEETVRIQQFVNKEKQFKEYCCESDNLWRVK